MSSLRIILSNILRANGSLHAGRRSLSITAVCRLREDALDYPIVESEVTEAVNQLTSGNGYYMLRGGYSREYALRARDRLLELVRIEDSKATHFTAEGADKQKRVWNVQNKGDCFMAMIQHPFVMAVCERFLGDDFALGSIASNTLLPGATGQEPHLDYPYWDYHNRKHWPQNPKVRQSNFFMNLQATILLDDFTKLNGATGCIPGSQLEARWPDRDEFFKNCIQAEGKVCGIVVIVIGARIPALHHLTPCEATT